MNMQNTRGLGPHETLEIHELLRSELTSYKKLQASTSMVQDMELKQFINDSLVTKKEKIAQLQQFISTQGMMK